MILRPNPKQTGVVMMTVVIFAAGSFQLVIWSIFGPGHDIDGIVRITDLEVSQLCGHLLYTDRGEVLVPPEMWGGVLNEMRGGSVWLRADGASWDSLFAPTPCMQNHIIKLREYKSVIEA